jgi:hypothetical protein
MLCALLFLFFPARIQAQTKKVLFLGNSYTAANNLPQWVADIAMVEGDSLIFQAITPGGQYLANHATDPQVVSAFQQGGWDYIVMQEQSQIPVIPYYRESLMINGAVALKNLRDLYAPNASLLFFLTWGRELGGQQCNGGYCSFPFTDFYAYQDTLTWAYQWVADSVGAGIAPVGEIWREALLQHAVPLPLLDLFSSDGSHPDIQGSSLTALTLYSVIFEKYVQGNGYFTSGIDPQLMGFFRQIVDQNVWPRKQSWRLNGGPAVQNPCADSSNIYTFTYAGKTYDVIREWQSWEDAVDCAVQRGGKLVEINSQQEQDSIYDAIVNGAGVAFNYTLVPDGGGVAYVWIGATDMHTEGTWLWDGDYNNAGVHFWTGQGTAGNGNGYAVGNAFVNWGGKSTGTFREPDDYGNGQDCAALALNGWPSGTGLLGISGEWNDISCLNMLYYVVEYDSIITTRANPQSAGHNVYPNPAYNNVRVKGTGLLSLEILDMAGRSLLRASGRELDVQHLPPGMYLLKMEDEDGIHIEKLLIQR